MLRYGIISEVDAAKGLARVSFEEDDIVSDWLRILVPNSLKNKDECWLDVKEPVCCMMDENSENGIIIGAYYHEGNQPVIGNKDVRAVTFEDGTFVQFDRATSTLTIDSRGTVNINCTSGQVNIDSPFAYISGDVEIGGNLQLAGPFTAGDNITVAGNVEASGDVKAGLISLQLHKHSGVTTGPGASGPSIP